MRGLPSLSDYEMTSWDDYEVMQSGSRNAAAGQARGGSKNEWPMFGGVTDQCGTCHQPMPCAWQKAGSPGGHLAFLGR